MAHLQTARLRPLCPDFAPSISPVLPTEHLLTPMLTRSFGREPTRQEAMEPTHILGQAPILFPAQPESCLQKFTQQQATKPLHSLSLQPESRSPNPA